jgi:uncharacterized protein with von Willebrand factor type A (vWA) domain
LIGLVTSLAAELRERGIAVPLSRVLAAQRALAEVAGTDRDEAYRALRATLCSDRACWTAFDLAFLETTEGVPRRRHTTVEAPPPAGADGEEEAPPSPAARARRRAPGAWSRAELLHNRDFASCGPAELEAIRDYVRALAQETPLRRGRRRAQSRRGGPDLRRTLARARRRGGCPDRIVRARRRPARRRLLLAIDVSGSMGSYVRPLLIFATALQRAQPATETFVFATRLRRVSRELRDPDPDRALTAVAAAVPERGSGTRIGAAIGRLNRAWRPLLGSATTVCVVSDGCDRADPGELAAETARLARSCESLYWLNPDAGQPGYEPRTRGMLAVLPHVKALLPAGTLADLESVAAALAGPLKSEVAR